MAPLPGNGFHPDLRRAARLAPHGTVSNPVTLRLIRALTALPRSRTPGIEVVRLPSGVLVRLHRPPLQADSAPALLWMHGGGYVMGDARIDDRKCQRFANSLGITVAAVDYRLAPEHPYPAALDDCHAALRWLATQPQVDPTRIAIGGASAGGGLAASLAARLRHDTTVAVAHQLLVYPMLDDRSSDRSQPHATEFRLWNQKCNRFGWKSYLRDADPNLAVPARHNDLAGLPPAWIGVGTLDLFY